jgi:hypothetical protein
MTTEALTIRRAVAADRPVLARLALLDSQRPMGGGEILVAETGGEIHAAWSVEERRAIADPFAPTALEIALLRTRARQLAAAGRPPRLPRLPRLRRRTKGLALAR